MNARTTLCLVALFLICPLSAHAEQAATVNPAGHWEGEITLPTMKLAIRIDLDGAALQNADQAWTGTIDIPVQGLRGFKLSPVSVEGLKVRCAMPNIPGDPTFTGNMAADGKNIAGDFTQGGQKYPFTLARKERSADKAGETPAKGVPGRGLAGHWQGSLQASPLIELRLALEITEMESGKPEGILISMDQGGQPIPMSVTADDAGAVKLTVASVAGTYEGKFSADGSEIAGDWKQGGRKMPLVFKRLTHAAKLNRPQEPKKPYPYTEEEVKVETKAAGVTLAGTLTLPKGAGPHPAVVLITGSGPQDRDESLLGHKPFLVVADHLTRQGIAVLRYDDRGIGKSTGDFGAATHNDFVDDALAALSWLKARKEIDPKRIGLVGHSEGGVVAPLAAVKQPNDVAFLVLMAGVGVPMDELLVRQGQDIGRVMSQSEADIVKAARSQREMLALLKGVDDAAAAEKLVRERLKQQLSEYTPQQREAIGMTDDAIEAQAKVAATPWFRQLAAYDPGPALRQVKCPVLAINGEKDLQVAAQDNLAGIRDALAAGGNNQVKTVEFPGLNHLFQHCTTGAISEYGQIEETFSPEVLKTISDWIREQTRL
jgi:pimeloyl-ACP methyl ester carboxylesterase